MRLENSSKVDTLLRLGRRLRDQINLANIEAKLTSLSLSDQLDSMLFMMSHLCYSGAIAEANIDISLASQSLPPAIESHPSFTCIDKMLTLEAWQGKPFQDTQNIIGSIAFMVVILFHYESFVNRTKDFINPDSYTKKSETDSWLKESMNIPSSKIDALKFLKEYRNSWHDFGVYSDKKRLLNWRSLTLNPGERLPIISTEQSMTLLNELVDVVIALNNERKKINRL